MSPKSLRITVMGHWKNSYIWISGCAASVNFNHTNYHHMEINRLKKQHIINILVVVIK